MKLVFSFFHMPGRQSLSFSFFMVSTVRYLCSLAYITGSVDVVPVDIAHDCATFVKPSACTRKTMYCSMAMENSWYLLIKQSLNRAPIS